MSEYVVQKGCMGFTMEDGTRYNADRRGHIKVDNPEHAYHVERNSRIAGGHIATATQPLDPRIASTWCKDCKFTGWGWQKNCPKCGAELEKVPGAE